MTKYVFSFNEEDYNNCDGKNIKDVIKSLIKDGELQQDFDLVGHAIVHIGEPIGYADKGEDCFCDVLGSFQERAYNCGGNYAESYLDTVSKEAEEYLKKELNRIWKKFKKINKEVAGFYQVENVKTYRVEMDGSYSEIGKDKQDVQNIQ